MCVCVCVCFRHQQNTETTVTEILLVALGPSHKTIPYLFALVDGDLVVYSAFPYHDLVPTGHLHVRFSKVSGEPGALWNLMFGMREPGALWNLMFGMREPGALCNQMFGMRKGNGYNISSSLVVLSCL